MTRGRSDFWWGNSPDLLADEPSLARALFLPAGEEELAEEGIQGLLDAFFLIAAGVLLLLQGGEEPFQDEEGTFCRVWFGNWRAEDARALGPVGWELGGGLGAKDEGWRGDVGDIAANCCYRL